MFIVFVVKVLEYGVVFFGERFRFFFLIFFSIFSIFFGGLLCELIVFTICWNILVGNSFLVDRFFVDFAVGSFVEFGLGW